MDINAVFKTYGIPGLLLVILFLIIQDPERAIKLKALFLKPFYEVFKWGSKQYIASEVGYTSTSFLRRHVTRFLPSIPTPSIKIKWVTSPSDPVFQRDGTLIIRLQETNDQTRNILTATRIALPHILFPLLRPGIQQYAQSAIDLTVLKKMSDKMGKHAQPVFQRYFLTPEIEEDTRAAELFTELIKVDISGIFVSVLIEELNVFGEGVYGSGDTSDKTAEIISFIKYLISIATRDLGQEIQLEFFSPNFSIGIMLLAISRKAQTEGLPPYIRRMDKILKSGCDSIYIISYPNAWGFLRRLIDALDTDQRLKREKWNSIPFKGTKEKRDGGISEIVLYRRNAIFEDATLSERLDGLGITEGMIVKGVVRDVSQYTAMVDLGGIYAVVSLEDSSWRTQTKCHDVFHPGYQYDFLVKSINLAKDTVNLSRRVPDEDPWQNTTVPKLGEVIHTEARFFTDNNFICVTDDGLEVILPKEEVSWSITGSDEEQIALGSRQELIVTDVIEREKRIIASLRRTISNPWLVLQKELPNGTEVTAIISAIEPNNLTVILPNQLKGYVPRQYVREAGYQYATFTKGLSVGQSLNLLVSKVFSRQQKIRLTIPPKKQQGSK